MEKLLKELIEIDLYNFLNINESDLPERFSNEYNKIIKKAYLKNNLKYHPDKVGHSEENINNFNLNTLIYEILTNPQEYDKYMELKSNNTNDFISLKDTYKKVILYNSKTKEEALKDFNEFNLKKEQENNIKEINISLEEYIKQRDQKLNDETKSNLYEDSEDENDKDKKINEVIPYNDTSYDLSVYDENKNEYKIFSDKNELKELFTIPKFDETELKSKIPEDIMLEYNKRLSEYQNMS